MNKSINDLLQRTEVIAVVGCSDNRYRTSYHIADYLQKQGFRIIPVNPNVDTVFGEKSYPALYDIPEDVEIDIVDIFRAPEFTAEMVDDVIRRMEQTGQKPVVWTQLGVSSEEAKKKATDAGLDYVEEKCLMVEHRKWMGNRKKAGSD